MIPKELIEQIHELHAHEQESVEAHRRISDAESARKAEKMTEKLENELVNLETAILTWVVSQPEFTDPDPESPEKTPAYFHAAADVLQLYMDCEPYLWFLSSYWTDFTDDDVVGY